MYMWCSKIFYSLWLCGGSLRSGFVSVEFECGTINIEPSADVWRLYW